MSTDHDHDHDHDRDRDRDGDRSGASANTNAGEAVDRRRFRTVGAVHLGLAAAVNGVTGVALLYLGATDRLVRWTFAELDTYVTAEALVREATTVAAVARTGAVIVGLALLAAAAAAAVVAVAATRDRRAGAWLPVSVVAALNPLATPLALIAAALLWLGRPRPLEPA